MSARPQPHARSHVKRIVLTGGPGAGKTSLLLGLHARGYAIVHESARAVIRERRASGLSPRSRPSEFASEVLRRDIECFEGHNADSALSFYDRSVLDALWMLEQVTPFEPRALQELLSRYPYHRTVFILPPWDVIYAQDAERDQTFAEAVRVHGMLDAWYRRCGYELIEVPKVSVAERCDYVLQTLAAER